jgi:hypothetical protein
MDYYLQVSGYVNTVLTAKSFWNDLVKIVTKTVEIPDTPNVVSVGENTFQIKINHTTGLPENMEITDPRIISTLRQLKFSEEEITDIIIDYYTRELSLKEIIENVKYISLISIITTGLVSLGVASVVYKEEIQSAKDLFEDFSGLSIQHVKFSRTIVKDVNRIIKEIQKTDQDDL